MKYRFFCLFICIVATHACGATQAKWVRPESALNGKALSLRSEWEVVQTGSKAKCSAALTQIWRAVFRGTYAGDRGYLMARLDRNGYVATAIAAGPYGRRTVKILLYANFDKWPNSEKYPPDLIKRVPSWFFDYAEAKTFAESSVDQIFGGIGVYEGMGVALVLTPGVEVSIVFTPPGTDPPNWTDSFCGYAEYTF